MRSPRQRVEQALRSGHSDRVPFTIYETMIPQSSAEREMRQRGLCIVKRDVPVYITHLPNVRVTEHTYWDGSRRMTRTQFETPVGTVSTLTEAAGFTQWFHEKMFKSLDDYATIRFLIEDEVYEPNYDAFARAQAVVGDDAIFRAQIGDIGFGPSPVVFGLEPLQTFISGNVMDMQTFALEWMDHRDEILSLYDVVVEKRREVYKVVAESPAWIVNYGGNVAPEVIGPKDFEEYYVPHYNEAAEIMHEHGKLIGCHFDANCGHLSEAIARTDLDYIEAFTPAPDTDMTLAEARVAWPNKVLWLNFPSSVHLKSDVEVEQITVDLLNELPSVDGVIMGVTENMPPERWPDSCLAIMDGLDRHTREQPQVYTTSG